MGVDAGFDMVPRLTKGAEDKRDWDGFIQEVKNHYLFDGRMVIMSTYLLFDAGEQPTLPFDGHKFLRFSSKVSGSSTAGSIIRTISRIAGTRFGSRICYWNEGADSYGFYNRLAVNASLMSYDKPEQMDTVDSAAGFGYDTNIREDFKRPLFKVHPVLGRGLGLVACLDIAKGSRIVAEAPLLVAKSMSPEALEPILGAKLKSLSKEEQRRYLSLYNNHPGKHPFSGIMRTNALPCGPGSTIGAVYTTICRINHSCVANCHNNWNDTRRLETIHAVRNIQAGEEITICYSKGGRSEDRQTELKQAFGFDCTCATCALPAADLAVSDDRCARIQHLDRAIGDPQRMMSNPAASLADCYALLQLLQAEYAVAIGANAARLYYDAFQISIAHADQARAAAFAERGYRCRIECEGEDSPETQRTEGFIENPAGHPSFALCSQRWRSQVKSTPRGLDADAFDRWLWGRKERR